MGVLFIIPAARKRCSYYRREALTVFFLCLTIYSVWRTVCYGSRLTPLATVPTAPHHPFHPYHTLRCGLCCSPSSTWPRLLKPLTFLYLISSANSLILPSFGPSRSFRRKQNSKNKFIPLTSWHHSPRSILVMIRLLMIPNRPQ